MLTTKRGWKITGASGNRMEKLFFVVATVWGVWGFVFSFTGLSGITQSEVYGAYGEFWIITIIGFLTNIGCLIWSRLIQHTLSKNGQIFDLRIENELSRDVNTLSSIRVPLIMLTLLSVLYCVVEFARLEGDLSQRSPSLVSSLSFVPFFQLSFVLSEIRRLRAFFT